MPLTPEDVANKQFSSVRLREGYDMEEVDQFLDDVEQEIARLLRENDDLRGRLSASERAVAEAETTAAEATRKLNEVEGGAADATRKVREAERR
ncbi:MAG TPA: DivIVA domain-containing protein, partial [Actinomycetes bacterium]|nr:DivIVA domain-containing protein [Actinomycetes bacterium]